MKLKELLESKERHENVQAIKCKKAEYTNASTRGKSQEVTYKLEIVKPKSTTEV